jgi:hypothetical protein
MAAEHRTSGFRPVCYHFHMAKKAMITTAIPSVEATAAQYGVSQQDLRRVRKAVGLIFGEAWARNGRSGGGAKRASIATTTGVPKYGGGANPRTGVTRAGRTRMSGPNTGRTRAKK